MPRTNEFTHWLAARGAAHTSDARAEGYSAREMLAAVRTGAATRVGKSWIAAPGCDPATLAAAAVRGRVTCVSAAAAAGIWTPDHQHIHVAVRGNASRFDPQELIVHWSAGPAPIGRNAVRDPIVNVLYHVARCLPEREALAVWESAIRTKKVEPAVLARVAWRSSPASRLAAQASELSDSHLESRFVDGMRRAGVVVRQQVWIDGHRVDGLIGDLLVTQIDGFAFHSRPADRRRDIAADARLALRGYTVLRFDFWQVLFDWDTVVATVHAALAQRLHLAA